MLKWTAKGKGLYAVKTIGILCASDTELVPFLARMKTAQKMEKAMLTFYSGTLPTVNVKVVAVYSGVCKVNAAVAAQLLIEAFHAEAVINAGTAGGMDERVQLFDTVVAEQTAYHDVAGDILTEFHPWMQSVYFQADERLLAAARTYSRTAEHPVLFGKIVTGEQFITDENREKINAAFAPLAVDMESASVAHVCHVNGVPFLAVRTVTDTAAHSGAENFERNCEQASEIAAKAVVGILEQIAS